MVSLALKRRSATRIPALSKSSRSKPRGAVVAAKPPVSCLSIPSAHLSTRRLHIKPRTRYTTRAGTPHYTETSLVLGLWPLGSGSAPAELYTLALGYKEQVVPDLLEILIVKGQYAEPAVFVSPDKRCQIPNHPSPGRKPPGVRELKTLLREVYYDVPPLVRRHLEVAPQALCREHSVLQIFSIGPFVGLDPGEVLGVVNELRGCGCIEAVLGYPDTLGGIKPNKGNWRAPQVLYNPESYIAPPPGIFQSLGVAGDGELHVSGFPRVRFPYRTQPPSALAYALYLFHDRAILQPAPARCSRPTASTKKARAEAPAPQSLYLWCPATRSGSRRAGTRASTGLSAPPLCK